MKYDAKAFSDGIIAKINEAEGDLEAIARILDKTGETQDYRWGALLYKMIIKIINLLIKNRKLT